MKTLNTNSFVRIKLTSFGIEWMKKNHEEIQKAYPYAIGEFKPPVVDENGYTKMQLWVVMKTFGDLLNRGPQHMPFEKNIQIDEAEFEEFKR